MTTAALASTGVTGVRRAVGDELRALADFLDEAEWPPWADARFDDVMARLRHTIDAQLDRHTDDVPVIAARLGLDFELLEAMAADPEQVGRWVSVLTGRTSEGRENQEVIAELLSVHLFADELAFIGLLARAIGPVDRASATA